MGKCRQEKMKRLYFNIDKENNKVILDRKDFDYLMSIGHYNDKAIEYIENNINGLKEEHLYIEFTKEKLYTILDILKGSDKE